MSQNWRSWRGERWCVSKLVGWRLLCLEIGGLEDVVSQNLKFGGCCVSKLEELEEGTLVCVTALQSTAGLGLQIPLRGTPLQIIIHSHQNMTMKCVLQIGFFNKRCSLFLTACPNKNTKEEFCKIFFKKDFPEYVPFFSFLYRPAGLIEFLVSKVFKCKMLSAYLCSD